MADGVVTNQIAIDQWAKDDKLAQSYLFNTCNEEQQNSLLTCDTAHSIWNSLTSRYQQNTVERRQSLQQDFSHYRFKQEHTVRSHIEAIKLLVQQFKDAGGLADDDGTCNKIITSLPPSYNNFLTAWESSPILERTLANLVTRLDREERRKSNCNGGELSADDQAYFGIQMDSTLTGAGQSYQPDISQRAANRQSPYPIRGRARDRGIRFGGSSRHVRFATSNGTLRTSTRCSHCNIIANNEKDCRNKKSGLIRCKSCNIIGHFENECYSRFRAQAQEKANVADQSPNADQDTSYIAGLTLSDSRSKMDFFLDSGATQHITSQKCIFTNFRNFQPGSRWIGGIGQLKVDVFGVGEIDILTSVNGIIKSYTIHDVLYAPSIGINLISVGPITNKGAEIHFVGSQALIVRKDIVEMTAERVGKSLYLLNISIKTADVASVAQFAESSLQEWHQRLAHIGYRTIINMAESGAVDGLSLQQGAQPPLERCHECAIGKIKRLVFSTSSTPTSDRIGTLIHSDVYGPMQIQSIGGASYYVLFHDNSSGFRVVRFIKHRSEVADCFKDFVRFLYAQTGQLVAVLRSDNGGEYENNELQIWLRKWGIRHETSVRHTPQQNGVSERDNRTIMEGARTLLQSNKCLPLTLWAEAVNYVVYILNRALSSTCPIKTPYEAWYGKKPDLSNTRPFGSEFYTLVPNEMRRKIDPKGLLGYFVGKSDTKKGDRFWDPPTGKVFTSRDVTPSRHHYERGLPQEDRQNELEVFSTCPQQVSLIPETSFIHSTPTDSTPPVVNGQRRSARVKARIESRLRNNTAASAYVHSEPAQYRDAVASDDAPEWKAAMDREFQSLMKNRTWRKVELPPRHSLIRSRWAYKFKPGYGEREGIYKARFVAKDFSQVPGQDYSEGEIYSPVVKHDSLRVLLSIAASLDLELHQLDVKTAFLYGDLDEELYVQQPEGFIQPGEEHLVCRLHKPLYGLKQSSRKWNEKFDWFLIQFGLTRSTADQFIYFSRGEDPDDFIMLGIWVDDGLIASKSTTKARGIIQFLETYFEMTSGIAKSFIGLEISRDRPKKKIYVTQSRYIQALLERFRMTDWHPSKIPADPNSRLVRVPSTDYLEDNPESTQYRALIGGLLYAMGMTRPDIAFAVIAASRHCQSPGKPHWKAAKMILAYLAGTPNHGLCFSANESANHLVGYSDADYAGCPDTRRSTTDLIFLFNGGPIAWKSHVQKSVAQSTAEAEYYAAGYACREIVWLRENLNQLGIQQPTVSPLLCDSKSAILMMHNPVFHDRTKHIGVKNHYIRQQIRAGEVNVVLVSTSDQLADMLTKPLPTSTFELNRTRIGVVQKPSKFH